MSKQSTNGPANGVATEKSYFETQREALLRDIGVSMEQVLQNLNKLNRNLEGVIAVGNEFSSVEALWSHFENVMAKNPEDGEDKTEQADDGDEEATRRLDEENRRSH